ncbi:MAG: isoprenylcysteine carboxylmethyltransferase family protein [Gemmatimonadota bacterium]|nr:isoprenylcysteine carboxylmethyltransferase family protein [Gemmatimonadota bacterium]MDH3369173.1 isoprenylcysteine carboxylmethyltransferase family protein [Gemmatimonadota bacterium]MDH3477741.1 isoprenylcysteine carboxylmethyltransferase family protein [Gemmatimonadota bacterium]MDH5549365.1 isoprenylcysteine carboxylmethyltransferase family protein [Gemmatimonadota bacterium]
MSPGLLYLLLSPPIVAVGLLKYRADYRRHQHTTWLGLGAVTVAFLMPHMVLNYAFPMVVVPRSTIETVGMSIMALGLAGCLWPLRHFSKNMWTGMEQPHLVTSGPYRYSRNPQYVTYFFFLAGYAIMGRTILAWVALVLYWIVTHLIVLIEEEHLERRFGDAYRTYKRDTPRYLFW